MPAYATDQCVSPDAELLHERMSVRAHTTASLLRFATDVEVVKTTVADGLRPMPDGVYTLRFNRANDRVDYFLHPTGRILPYYYPVDHDS